MNANISAIRNLRPQIPKQNRRGVLESIRASDTNTNSLEVGINILPHQSLLKRNWKEAIGTILFEDEALLVLDKKRGVLSHKTEMPLELGLIESIRLCKKDNQLRLVHRLDKSTSGVILIAKTKLALLELQKQMGLGQIVKKYYSIASGTWPSCWKREQLICAPQTKGPNSNDGRVCIRKNGFLSQTAIMKLRGWKGCALLIVMPLTGRTHQIRLHCNHIGLPVFGDTKYGPHSNSVSPNCPMLHASSLSVLHPHRLERLTFTSPLPFQFDNFLEQLEDKIKFLSLTPPN
ncbi:ribosomal large subunit pseudouridine synthase C [Candidatus Tremblaya phenacola PAVE]|nr:ribosomal large subunit pseudouridine synthase C [Candidatus Tremblaya phenacola PAVE]